MLDTNIGVWGFQPLGGWAGGGISQDTGTPVLWAGAEPGEWVPRVWDAGMAGSGT